MLRVLFFVAIALGAAMYFPQSRAVVLDVSEPVLNPVRRWSTRGEMRQIARDLESESQTGSGFPQNQEEFVLWMDRTYREGSESSMDPWGNVYTLRFFPDSFGVVSLGPDGQPETGDEEMVTGELEGTVRRRR